MKRNSISPTAVTLFAGLLTVSGAVVATMPLLPNPASMDLSIAGGQVNYACGINGSQICQANPWPQYSQPSSFSCNGCFENWFNTFHLNTVYLAENANNIFMSGVQGNSTIPGVGAPYGNLVYILPHDGSCGSQSCAQHVINLPTMYSSNVPRSMMLKILTCACSDASR